MSKAEIIAYGADLLKDCKITSVSSNTLFNTADLIKKYDFQFFDSIIVASALEANCTILFSEDMQHGLVVNGMTILNPFL